VHRFRSGKFSAYSDSNSDHRITWAIFTQRLSADNFPPKGSSKSEGEGGASSAFLYTRVVMQGFRSCFSYFSYTRTPFFAQTTDRVFTWTTDSASPIYQFSAGTHSHATKANRPAFNFSLRYRPSLAIETLVKAISEVEGVFSQPTPEVDTSGLNDGSLHLIVRYWTLPQPQVRRTKTKAVVAIKVAKVRAEIKIPQPVPVTLYSRTLDPE
jgi:hypothetical protein